MISDVLKQIKTVTMLLIEKGMTLRENFPARRGTEIVWSSHKSLGMSFEEKAYEEIYLSLVNEGEYNLVMLDGGVVQLMYSFDPRGRSIVKHRLAYYPKPKEVDMPEALARPIESILAPFRFDFDSDAGKHKDIIHSFSHCTFGNLKDCRISATKELTPYQFFSFLFRMFYLKELELNEIKIDDLECALIQSSRLTSKEAKHLHLSI